MTIAGVKPFKINYLDDDVFIENAWDEPESEIHSGFPETFVGYMETQVREILIKLLVDMPIENVDGLSTLKTIPDKGLVTEQSEKLVDEFMESGK